MRNGQARRSVLCSTSLILGVLLVGLFGFPARAADEILVSNFSASSVTVYARTASGDVTPLRTILTGLDHPHNFDADFVHQELFVPNNLPTPNAAINVYDLDASSPGADTPKRTISGALTLLNRPTNVAVDTVHGEIYVANDISGASSIAVFALDAVGNVAPLRTLEGALTGIDGPVGMAVDTVNDELFVVSYKTANGGSVTVFPRTASGNVAPSRTLQGTTTLLQDPQGMVLDVAHDEFYVTNSKFTTALAGDVLVFARTASGDTAPVREISGPTTGLCNPAGAFLDAIHDELVVANTHFGTGACQQSVTTYARTASGDAAPLRLIGPGPVSALGEPVSVVVRTTATTGCTGAPDGTPCDDGNPCTVSDSCQSGACTGGSPLVCTPSDACHGAGVCNPATGACTIGAPVVCAPPDACHTAGVCVPATGCSYPAISCDDGNPCTNDSCDPASGCHHVGSEGPDNSCSTLTDADSCSLQAVWCAGSVGPGFRLREMQTPTYSRILGRTVFNDYSLNALSPGMFAYNVFQTGAPGSHLDLSIQVPFPFVTQGNHPIHVYDGASTIGACLFGAGNVQGAHLTSDGGHYANNGQPLILSTDYAVQNIGATTHVHVTGTVPASGLVYVTIQLDYGLKRTTGWQRATDGTTAQGPDTNLDGIPDGLGNGSISIASPQSYSFGFTGVSTHTSSPTSCTIFKQKKGGD